MFAIVMKKNRTFILLLLFAFTFSNVGLPFTVHFCAMMEKMNEEKCISSTSETVQTEMTCCEKENKSIVNFSSFKKTCCESKIAAEPLNEKYLIDSSILQKIEIKTPVIFISPDILFTKLLPSKNFSNNSSPPLQISNGLYLVNSILLI